MPSLKIKYGSDIRRVHSLVPELRTLRELVGELFGAQLPSNYTLKYVDDEGDLISLRCENDVVEAFHLLGDKTLVIHVVPDLESVVPVPCSIVAHPPTTNSTTTATPVSTVDLVVEQPKVVPLPVPVPAQAAPAPVEVPLPSFEPSVEMSVEDFFARLIMETRNVVSDANLESGVEELRETGQELLEYAREKTNNSLLLAQLSSLFLSLNERLKANVNAPALNAEFEQFRQKLLELCQKLSAHPQFHFDALKQLFEGSCQTEQACEISAPLHQRATFHSDVTIADGQLVQSGQVITKIWRLVNTGDFFAGDNQLVLRSALKNNTVFPAIESLFSCSQVRVPVVPRGDTFDVELTFTAPVEPGHYRAYFRLVDSNGNAFGDRLWVDFVVEVAANLVQPLNRLLELGFATEPALVALQATGGNFNDALELLLTEDESAN